MKRIFKYPLSTDGISSVGMPKDGVILRCKLQNGRPCIWVLTENLEEMVTRHFKAFMTGEHIPAGINMDYIETLILQNGMYVIHIFELKK